MRRGERDIILKVLRGVARSITGTFDMSFEDPNTYAGSKSGGFLKQLIEFAPAAFWKVFIGAISDRYPSTDTPNAGDDCLIQHLRRAIASAAAF
jgi:hypothetical protein